MNNIIICGIDRIGKSTLVSKLLKEFSDMQVKHSGKPFGNNTTEQMLYQYSYFKNYMQSANNIIFDRFHIGECVYAPLYRQYSGEYIFELEKEHPEFCQKTKLILLYINNLNLRRDDNKTDNFNNGTEEQQLFVDAFYKSNINNKIIIDVDNEYGFKSFIDIYNETIHFINN